MTTGSLHSLPRRSAFFPAHPHHVFQRQIPQRVLVRVQRPLADPRGERGPLSGPGDEVASLAHHRGGDQRGPRGERPDVPARESSLSPGRRDRSLENDVSPSAINFEVTTAP